MEVQRRTGLEARSNHVAAFYVSPEKSGEAGPESNGLICLTEGILRKGGFQAVAWLLFTVLIHVYSEKATKMSRNT